MQLQGQTLETRSLEFSAENVMGLVTFKLSVTTFSRKTTTFPGVTMILMEKETKMTTSATIWPLQLDPTWKRSKTLKVYNMSQMMFSQASVMKSQSMTMTAMTKKNWLRKHWLNLTRQCIRSGCRLSGSMRS